MPGEPSQPQVFPDITTKVDARAAELRLKELKEKVLKSQSRKKTEEGSVNDSIDELIRQNSGGRLMATPTPAADGDTGNPLVDTVLKQVVHSPMPAPPIATTAAAASTPTLRSSATESTHPTVNANTDIVMPDAPNRDKSHPATPTRTASGPLGSLLERDEDLKDWLMLTNYWDVDSRKTRLEAFRVRTREKLLKVQAIEARMKQMEAERRKLMEEVEPDMNFMWPAGGGDSAAAANRTSNKESTTLKGGPTDTLPTKRMATDSDLQSDGNHRPEKLGRFDEEPSHARKQTSAHRGLERGEIDERDSYGRRPYIKTEDGRRSPPRRQRDWSPPRGHGPAADYRGHGSVADYHGRPDRNDQRGQESSGYRREQGPVRRSLGRTGPPAYFDVGAKGDTRYFIVKSWNEENVYKCMEEGIWVTQEHNEGILNRAFTQTKNVILFFSANGSKAFQGYARMISPTSPNNPAPRWTANLNWPCSNPFRVRWLSKIEVEFYRIGHLKNSLNQNLSVLVGKDGQEIEENCGASLLKESYEIARDKWERRDVSVSFLNQ